ncbi:uncharacterized protein LOC121053030 isoform X2 [Rosa chinensis]|uniref:uncharacterized protein LOC121053030 isoform X2 n=1 Tax=Rosa chinensis TaxID=74649 RepID=UPI001AD92A09|nr:uncharacterized protein LOC121053030 isoform X2 [Rosa chinensis]
MEKELSKVSKAADAMKLCDQGAEYDIASAAGLDSRGCFEVGFHISYWVWLGYSCDYLVDFFVTVSKLARVQCMDSSRILETLKCVIIYKFRGKNTYTQEEIDVV